MDTKKKAEFVRRMGKKRFKLAKGGMIKRKNFDLGGLLGMAGGSGGTGFQTGSPVSGAQLSRAYDQSANAINQQGDIATTLMPQVSNAVTAQNTLAGQYSQQAQGAGPNVAQNKLNQATGANVKNQAALMAGQRGAGANPALIAREAAQQGAATQQTAAGEAATLQAQQQIAAEQAQAQLAANQIAQTQGATNAYTQGSQGEQSQLLNATTANNNVQGQLANTEMQGQQGLIGGLMNGAGAAIGLSEGGEVHPKLDFVHKMTKLGLEHHNKEMRMAEGGSVPSTPPVDTTVQDSMRKAFKYPGYDDGGIVVPQVQVQTPQSNFQVAPSVQGGFSAGSNAGAEAMGNSMKGSGKKKDKKSDINVFETAPQQIGPIGSSDLSDVGMTMAARGGIMGPHKSHVANYLMSDGGKVPALVSPGEVRLTKEQVHKVVHEGADPLKIGFKFGGEAKVKGDSKKNDTIPVDLEDGDVIIDREHVMSPEKATKFVHKSIARKKARSK